MEEVRPRKTWLQSNRGLPRRFARPLLQLTQVEASAVLAMLAALTAAIGWVTWSLGTYESFWLHEARLRIGRHVDVAMPVRRLINEGLMSLYALYYALVLKRELAMGRLRDTRVVRVGVAGGVLGLVAPVAVFLAVSGGGDVGDGWVVGMATDNDMALIPVLMLGTKLPTVVQPVLLVVAMLDDLGTIAVARFYLLGGIDAVLVAIGIIGAALVAVMVRVGIRNLAAYVAVGAGVWVALTFGGVDGLLAGILLGLLTPVSALYSDSEYLLRARWIMGQYEMDRRDPRGPERVDDRALTLAHVARESVGPLVRLVEQLRRPVLFLIVPLFIVANAGVSLRAGQVWASASSRTAIATFLALLLGKTIGIGAGIWLSGGRRLRFDWPLTLGVALLGCVAVSVGTLNAELAYTDTVAQQHAQLGLLAASLTGAVAGYLVLRWRVTAG